MRLWSTYCTETSVCARRSPIASSSNITNSRITFRADGMAYSGNTLLNGNIRVCLPTTNPATNVPTDPFYVAPDPLPDGKPGDVLRSQPLDGAPAGSQAWKVLYLSTGFDGRPTAVSDRMTYKSVLIEGVPNLAYLFGYTNISWTLKIDLAADYVCRLLNEMDRRGVAVVTPRAPTGEIQSDHVLGSLQAGYIQRDAAVLPRQGRELPWRVLHHLERDRSMLRQPLEDSALEWSAAA